MTVRRSGGHDGLDGHLRELFERQRHFEAAGIPSYPATVAAAQLQARRRVARRGLWLYGTISSAAVVVVAAVTMRAWFIRTPAIEWSAPLGVELTAVTWTSETDFLLDTPDAQALRGMPRLVRLRNLPPTPPAPANDTND